MEGLNNKGMNFYLHVMFSVKVGYKNVKLSPSANKLPANNENIYLFTLFIYFLIEPYLK